MKYITCFQFTEYHVKREGRYCTMPTTIDNVTVYSVPDLSEMLNVTTVSVRNYIKQGHLKGQKVMGRWFVSEQEVSEFLKTLSY
jgi:hypothetical protein